MTHAPTPQTESEHLRILGHRDGELYVERVYQRDLGSGVEDKSVREWLPLDVVTVALNGIRTGAVNARDINDEGRELLEREADRLSFVMEWSE